MIRGHDLHLAYGKKILFSGIDFQLNPGNRTGLVGPNGTGKTTLFRVLTGQQDTDGGQVERPRDTAVGYLPQEGIVLGDRPLIAEVESSLTTIQDLRRRQAQAEEDLAADSTAYHEAIERLSHYTQRLEELEEHKLRSRMEKILFGLGFRGRDMDRPCSEFSGGWQMRIALAKLLLDEPDLLLLDEPTNHLDLDSLRWLELFLLNYEGSLLIISHDQTFLDTLCNRILFLERGRMRDYTGNFSDALAQREAEMEQLEQARKSQDRKIAQTERFIERFRYKASKATQVQSRIKQLQKIERIDIEEDLPEIQFRFPPAPRSGQTVLRLDSIDKAYDPGEPVLRNLSLLIERGDRFGVVGFNGAGKSTLARIAAGIENYQKGARELGYKVALSYFAQDQSGALDPGDTVFSSALKVAKGLNETEIRNTLGAFLFRGDAVNRSVRVLSGGEKNRLALARMLLQPANFLILDEPTNHLDMTSKAVLQEALQNFDGSYLIVSHDRSFMKPLLNKVLEIRKSDQRIFPGTLDEFLRKLDEEAEAGKEKERTMESSSSRSSTTPGSDPRTRRREAARKRQQIAPLQKELSRLEARIEDLESRIKERETAMKDPAFFKRGPATAEETREYESWQRNLERAMEDWEKVQTRLETASDQEGGKE